MKSKMKMFISLAVGKFTANPSRAVDKFTLKPYPIRHYGVPSPLSHAKGDKEKEQRSRTVVQYFNMMKDASLAVTSKFLKIGEKFDEESLKEAENAITKFSQVKWLQDEEIWRHRQGFSSTVQKFVAALMLFHFYKTRRLVAVKVINETMQHSRVAPHEILLAVVNLTEMLGDLATSKICKDDDGFLRDIQSLVFEIHRNFLRIVPRMTNSEELSKKRDTIKQNLVKINKACYHADVIELKMLKD